MAERLLKHIACIDDDEDILRVAELTLEMIGGLRVTTFASGASALEVGQKAPDFTLNGTDGKPVKLSELTAKGPIIIYTFIAAFTGT